MNKTSAAPPLEWQYFKVRASYIRPKAQQQEQSQAQLPPRPPVTHTSNPELFEETGISFIEFKAVNLRSVKYVPLLNANGTVDNYQVSIDADFAKLLRPH